MALDIVIDPLAVRGDRWFLGRIFYYPDGGVYFGVPLSNFLGWWIVGTAGVGGYLALSDRVFGRRPTPLGRRPAPGVGLYYAVAVFNLAVTVWIGEGWLAAVGALLHVVLALALRHLNQTAAVAAVGLGEREVQRA